MPTIRVTKPFVFSHRPEAEQKLTTETRFLPGEHEVPDAIANHPWIKAGADGKIESPAQALERTASEAKKAAAAKIDADAANAAAEAAIARLTAAVPGNKASAEDVEREVNTPVNVLRAKRASGERV